MPAGAVVPPSGGAVPTVDKVAQFLQGGAPGRRVVVTGYRADDSLALDGPRRSSITGAGRVRAGSTDEQLMALLRALASR